MPRALSPDAAQRPSNRRFHAAIAGLLALSIAVQAVRDRGWQPYQPATPVLWFQAGPLLKRFSLGFNNLIADVYWIRAVVYYGSKRLAKDTTRNYDLLEPLLTFATTLDPQFRVAYRFGAIFLTEAYPSGPGRPDRAIALLERGLAANPNAWEYMYDIGFVHYWWLKNYKTAGQWFERASRLPGSPPWLPGLAATTLTEGGDRPSSRLLWHELRETAAGDWFRRNAQLRLTQLDTMDMVDELNKASQRFMVREGRPPRNEQELVLADKWLGWPNDPTGVPFVLDPVTGHIGVSRQSTLWPLPTDKGTVPALPPLPPR